ncbi:hypothetical protein [Staphylococcus kloosii]|uniref:hypothetical protein n=1 Tax=Staphylococcus kloosii TaxID=29384 RepID=UPI0028A3AE2F|nr:hypothetical protein [Staphylococcus kloosii]MDT3959072.1 hypothetical protein [Staphylococcus kloosii]
MTKIVYIDGTKIEVSANKYTFVWRKNIDRYNSKVLEQFKEIYCNAMLNEVIPKLNEEENDKITVDTLKKFTRYK